MTPDSLLRIGLVGCGGIARRHAEAVTAAAGAELAAVCDVDVPIMERFLADHVPDAPRPALFTDQEALYAESDLDGAVIATPHTMHFDHASRALAAGCHVLLEKPMVTTVADAYALRDRAAAAGKLLLIGYNTPCTPAFQRLRAIVREGRLGPLELVTGYLTQPWMENTSRGWRRDPALSGGGQAYDSGAHLLNSLIWTLEESPAEVYAMIDRKGQPVDINSALVARFGSGVLATIVISGNCPASASGMEFIFAGGRVSIDGWTGRWMRAYDGDGEIDELSCTGEASPTALNFLAAILGTEEPATGPTDGVRHSELMDALYESARIGRPVTPAGADGNG